MVCPNGCVDIRQLKKMIDSPEYNVWFVNKGENWTTSSKQKITTNSSLTDAILKELNDEGSIYYDTTDVYSLNHPCEGEDRCKPNSFEWEYCSFFSKRCFRICECAYIGKPPKYPSLEIVCFDLGFTSPCFQIGSWVRNDEGYEFKSCGSRLFEFIDERDLPIIWKAIKRTDEYLADQFRCQEC